MIHCPVVRLAFFLSASHGPVLLHDGFLRSRNQSPAVSRRKTGQQPVLAGISSVVTTCGTKLADLGMSVRMHPVSLPARDSLGRRRHLEALTLWLVKACLHACFLGSHITGQTEASPASAQHFAALLPKAACPCCQYGSNDTPTLGLARWICGSANTLSC